MDHLLDIETIPLERIDAILDKAGDIKSEMAKGRYSKKPLEGRIIFSMFLENRCLLEAFLSTPSGLVGANPGSPFVSLFRF